jgi:hypothetical protein
MSDEQRVILEDVDRYRVMDPLFECVRVVLAYQGELLSAPYIQGISGAAFRIAGICPCAPTCACAMSVQDLITLLGYEVDAFPLFGEDIDPEAERPRVLARVKDEIRAGRPAILWHAFTTCEWDVVAGFDDETQQFFGRGSYAGLGETYAVADQARTTTCTAICPALGAILIGDRVEDFNAREAELAALREAVRHAHSPGIPNDRDEPPTGQDVDGEQWVMLDGLACYDRWVRDFRANPPKLPTMGDRYCFGVYRSTHRAASEFMQELMPKYSEAKVPLERASRYFVAEADALNKAAELLFPAWKLPEQPNAEKNARATELLSVARDNYARAIDEIEEVLRVIDA